MPPIIITEKRFREGLGERYMVASGEVRCQAVSKGKLRRWREANSDFDTPTEDVAEDAEAFKYIQCSQPAIAGMFSCHWHGGRTPSKNKPNSIFDVMPLDLGEKLKTLMEHPDYISNRQSINLFQSRVWEIMEDLKEGYGGDEAWGMVADALRELREGRLSEAEAQLEEALKTPMTKKEAWSEIRMIQKIIDGMKVTEVKSAKELKLMATADQVAALLNHMYNVIVRGIEKYMTLSYINGYDERRAQADFMQYVAGEIYKSSNISPVTLGMLTEVSEA